MRQRNAKCSCGSGKKFKNCCRNKQPRTTTITGSFGEPVRIDEIRRNIRTNEVEFYSYGMRVYPKSTTTQHSYKRKNNKPDKIISKVYGSNKLYLALPATHLDEFDLIYSIDTNYKELHGIKCCASGIVRGEKTKTFLANATAINMQLKYCASFSSVSENPENVAWLDIINRIHLWENTMGKKIAIVVDSDLGMLEEYNQRKRPVAYDQFLPFGYTLLYASSDHDKDNPMNKMINLADFGASVLLKEYVKDLEEGWFFVCFDQVKIWTVEQENPNSLSFRG